MSKITRTKLYRKLEQTGECREEMLMAQPRKEVGFRVDGQKIMIRMSEGQLINPEKEAKRYFKRIGRSFY